ncbi:MAG: hypothetical protein JW928_01860 [Candidatus Aureabacteria bacterium]|nr:hypothetical protein [Candidatus Auribacterota bacterium]
MARKFKILTGFACICLMLFWCVVPAAFSDKYISASKLKVTQKTRSTVQSTSTQAGSRGRWTEIRLEFDTKVKWVDELTVRYFALVEDVKGQDILYGDITYLNVPSGKAHISSLFVHPATMAKYGKIISVHCEIWAQGKLRDVADIPSKPAKKWWEMKPPIKGQMVPKFYTPYSLDREYDGLAVKVE